MRDTPRTDAITPLGLAKDGSIPHYVIELAGLCRNLERENAGLLAALKRLVSILSPEIHGSDGSALEQARAAIARHKHE